MKKYILKTGRHLWQTYHSLQNSRFNQFIKVLIVLFLCVLLYHQTFGKEDIEEIWINFKQNLVWSNTPWLIGAFILMPINWALETLKWRQLIKKVDTLSFFKSYQAVLAGITFSIFTPNRIGEYGGRILMIGRGRKIKAIIATLVGSLAQLIILFALGLMGMLYFMYRHLNLDIYLLYSSFFLAALAIIIMIVGFFNIDLFIPICRRIPLVRRSVKYLNILYQYTNRVLLYVLNCALGRYLLYTFQYYLLLHFFGITMPFIDAVSCIALIFLIQTSVPLPPVIGLLVRGEIALNIWGFYTTNNLGILSATFGLWFINIIFPALIGLIFIISLDFSLIFGKKRV